MRHLLAFALTALALPAHATSLVFSDRTSWEAAVAGSIYTETFDSVAPQHIASGVGGTIVTPMFDIVLPPGMVHGAFVDRGFFRGDLHEIDAQVPEYDEFRFDAPIYALGLDVLYVEDAGSVGIAVSVAGATFELTQWPSFFGIVSDTPFTSAVFRDGGSAPRIYDLDNVSIAPAPEPNSFAMLVLGSVMLLLSCRGGARI